MENIENNAEKQKKEKAEKQKVKKAEKLQAPRGTVDIYGEDVAIWQFIEKTIREVCKAYCIDEIRTPIFEHTEVFKRDEEDTSDMVNKEMYSFLDKSNRSLTLRPELTAPVVRAFVEHKLYGIGLPQKYFYIGPCFRYEKPQAGRQRQFHQFGVEYFGSPSVVADAEVIALADTIIKKLGIKNYKLKINSIGDTECRVKYNESLKTFLTINEEYLCEDCKGRVEKNPLRTLDCKNEKCRSILDKAPRTIDVLGEDCLGEFESLKAKLTNLGIEFEVDTMLVRGLDYYTKTVFEFVSSDLGAQSAISGGGRYNKLVEQLGGPETPAVGFGLGMERLVLVLKAIGLDAPKNTMDVYIGSIGEKGMLVSEKLAYELRSNGVNCEINQMDKGVKAQMKFADKQNAKYVIIIGDNEAENKVCNIKNMRTNDSDAKETSVKFEEISEFVKKGL